MNGLLRHIGFFLAVFLIAIHPLAAAPNILRWFGDFYLLENGEINLEIVLPDKHSDAELNAANLCIQNLSKLAKKSSIKIVSENEAAAEKLIYILPLPNAEKISPQMEKNKSFQRSRIEIEKNSVKIYYNFAPENAVGDFLHGLGFRFYAPSELGAIIPEKQNIRLASGARNFYSPFFSAYLYGIKNGDRFVTLLNGERNIIKNFSHNLNKIFREEYFDLYPDFAPDKVKFLRQKQIQPKFNAPYADYYAHEIARLYFERNPESPSFSIGINDTQYFDKSVKQNPPPNDFARKYKNFSDTYFDFANKFAKELSLSHPDKFAACIAYLNLESPPSFKIESNILPFLTTDRACYFDKNSKKEDFELLKNWSQSGAKFLGSYDYLYGQDYHVPRLINDYVFEGINKAKEHGFSAYFAETGPIWAYDMQKLYITLRLLNSNDSVEKLEDEFYALFYPQSKSAIKEFFGLAKNAWQSRTDNPVWLSFFQRDNAAELFAEQRISLMDIKLGRALRLAKSDIEKRRLEQVRLAFEVTKAASKNYFLKKSLFEVSKKTKGNTEIVSLIKNSLEADEALTQAIENHKNFSEYKDSFRPNTKDFSAPIKKILTEIYPRLNDEEKAFLQSFYPPEEVEIIKACIKEKRTLLLSNFKGLKQTLDGDVIEEIAHFRTRALPSKNAVFKIDENEKCLTIKNCNIAELAKYQKAEANKIYSFKFSADYSLKISSVVYALLVFTDENYEVLKREDIILPAYNTPKSDDFLLAQKAPEGAKFVAFALIAQFINEGEFLKIKSLRLSKH